MWMSVLAATLLGLAAGQGGSKLSVANQRLTYGHLGPARETNQFLPGDVIHLMFEAQGMTFDAKGKSTYAISLALFDPKGADLLKQAPKSASTQNYLGGNSVPCAAHLRVPLESTPGDYVVKVTITDNATKQSVVVEQKLKILPKAFGLVQVGTSADREGTLAWSPVGVVGDSIFLNYSAVGFARDKTKKQPSIKVTMRVLDEKGQVVKGAEMTGEVNSDVPGDLDVVPMQFGITLNRVGRFTLELTATDALSGSMAKVNFPVRVLAP
jgi:hypothetical protein